MSSPHPPGWTARRSRRKFTEQELEDIWQAVQRFRKIVLRWVRDEALSEDEKGTIIQEFVYPRMGYLPDGTGKTMPGVFFWCRWPKKKGASYLDDLELTETTNESDLRLISYTLYRGLYEDVQAVKRGERLKPKLCALRAEPGTQQKECGCLFRPQPGPGPRQKYCSARCRSTASTRSAWQKKRRQQWKYIPKYM